MPSGKKCFPDMKLAQKDIGRSLELGCGFAKTSAYQVKKQLQFELEKAVARMIEIHNRVECAQRHTESEADELQRQVKASLEEQAMLCQSLRKTKEEETEERQRSSELEQNVERSTKEWARSALSNRESAEDVGELRAELAEFKKKGAEAGPEDLDEDLDPNVELELMEELKEAEAERMKARNDEEQGADRLNGDLHLLRTELFEVNMLLEHSSLMSDFDEKLMLSLPCESPRCSPSQALFEPTGCDRVAPSGCPADPQAGSSANTLTMAILEASTQQLCEGFDNRMGRQELAEIQEVEAENSSLRSSLHAAEMEVVDLQVHMELCEQAAVQMQQRLTSEIGMLRAQCADPQPQAPCNVQRCERCGKKKTPRKSD